MSDNFTHENLSKLVYSIFRCENEEAFTTLKFKTEQKLNQAKEDDENEQINQYSNELSLMATSQDLIYQLRESKNNDSAVPNFLKDLLDLGLKKYTSSSKKIERLRNPDELKKEYEEQKEDLSPNKLTVLTTLINIQTLMKNYSSLISSSPTPMPSSFITDTSETSIKESNKNNKNNNDDIKNNDNTTYSNANSHNGLFNKNIEAIFQSKMKRVELIPDCKEKKLMIIKFILHSLPNVINFDEKKKLLEEEFQKLIEDLKLEELYSDEISKNIEEINQFVDLKDFQSVQTKFKKLSKHLMTFNVFKVVHLIQLSEQCSSTLTNENIILFYAKTGAGKTTTIHYLGGSKMGIVKSQALDHVAPIEITNPALKNSTVGASTKSETKYLNAVPVSLTGVRANIDFDKIIICDPPGTGDTRGAERDVAYGISTMRCIRKAKTVRLVLIFSYRDGGRAEGISQLVQTLTQCVTDVTRRLDSFCYLLTQFPKNTDHKQLLNFAKDIKTNKGQELGHIPCANALLNDIVEKLEEKDDSTVFLVDPLDGKPKKLLETILDTTKPIKRPNDVFKDFVPKEAQDAVEAQARIFESDILKILKKPEKFCLLFPKLHQLETMARLLNNAICENIFKKVMEQLKKDLQTMYELELGLLERYLGDENNLTLEDVQRFSSFAKSCSSFGELNKLNPELNLPSSLSIMDSLSKKVNLLFENFDFSSQYAELRLRKMSLLCKEFPELSNKYEQIVETINYSIKRIVEEGLELLTKEGFDDFEDIARKLEKLQRLQILSELAQSLNINQQKKEKQSIPSSPTKRDQEQIQNENNYEQLLSRIKKYLDDLIKNVRKLTESSFNKEQEEGILNIEKVILKAKETSLLHSFIPKEEIKKIYENCIDSLTSFIKRQLDQLQIRDQKDLEQILMTSQPMFEQIKNIRSQIPKLARKTEMIHNDKINSLIKGVSTCASNAESLLNKLDDPNSNSISIMRELVNFLIILSSAKWIEEFQQASYSFLISNLNRKFYESITDLENDLVKLNYSLEQPDDLSKVNIFFQKLDGLINLSLYLPEVSKKAKEVKETILKGIREILNSNDSYFNLNERTKDFYQNKLNELETYEREILCFRPEIIFLKEKGFENFDLLKQKQTNIENSIKEMKEKVSQATYIQPLNRLMEIKKQIEKNKPKAKSILKKNNFVDMDHFTTMLKKHENVFGNDQKQLKELEKEQNLLKDIHNLFLEKKSYPSSEEMNNKLKEFRFNSFQSLKDSIETTKNQIKSFADRTYYFDSLDCIKCEKYLKFLNACNSILDLRNECQKFYTKIEAYLKAWKEFTKEEIYYNWKIIDSYSSNNETNDEKLNECATSIFNSLQFLQRIKERSNLTFQKMNGDELLNELIDIFKKYHFRCNLEIPNLENSKEISTLERLNKVTRNLILLDSFSENQNYSFTQLHEILEKKLSKTNSELIKRIDSLLDQRDYNQICLIIRNAPENNRQELFDSVSKEVISIHNRLKKDIRNLSLSDDIPAEMGDIESNVEFIHNILEQLTNLWDENFKKNLQKLIRDTEEALNEFFNKHLKAVDRLIDGYQMKEANEKFKSIFKWISQFRFISNIDVLQKEVNRIETRLQDIEKELENKFKTMKLEDFYSTSPKKNLQQFSSTPQLFTKLQQALKENIRSQIEAISIEDANFEKSLTKIEGILQYVDDDTRLYLASFLKERKEEISKQKKAFENSVLNECKIDNFKKVNELYKEHSNKSNYQFVNLLKSQVEKISQESYNLISGYLKDNDLLKFFEELIKLYVFENGLEEKLISNKRSLSFKLALNKIWKDSFSKILALSNNQNVVSISKLEDTLNMFNQFLILSKLKENDWKVFSPENFESQSKSIMKNLIDFLKIQIDKFWSEFDSFNWYEASDLLNQYEKLKSITELIQDINLENFSNSFTVPTYSSIIRDLNKKLEELILNLKSIEFINEETKKIEKNRIDFYSELSKKYKSLDQFQNDYVFAKTFSAGVKQQLAESIKLCFQNKEKRISQIEQKTLEMVDQIEYPSFDFKESNIYLDNLNAINNELNINTKNTWDQIKSRMETKIQKYSAEFKSNQSIQSSVSILLKMKLISQRLARFRGYIDNEIDKLLAYFQERDKGGLKLKSLAAELQRTPEGSSIVAEHSALSGIKNSLFNQRTQKQGIDYVLKNLEGNNIDRNHIKEKFNEFNDLWEQLIEKYIASTVETNNKNPDRFDNLIAEFRSKNWKQPNISNDSIDWGRVVNQIPEMMAYIFSLWTLTSIKFYEQASEVEKEERMNYLLRPHPAQIVSIFRILGIGYTKKLEENPIKYFFHTIGNMVGNLVGFKSYKVQGLCKNLIQIGTGEGKSVTLAVTAIILSLLGFEVSCVCYSSFLSERDYNNFADLFENLGVKEYIKYGTFHSICEEMLNKQGDIRKKVEDLISNTNSNSNNSSGTLSNRPRILLIDEVDVFFNKNFYGNLYCPAATLKDESISNLIDYLWKNRSSVTLETAKSSNEFQQCLTKKPGWENLLTETLLSLIHDLKHFSSHKYILYEGKIGYKLQDSVVTNIRDGYYTLFAYYQEYEKGKIIKESLDEFKGILIKCGNYSYAEIPHQFACIMGVTGTLANLSEPEKKVIEEDYRIKLNTYMPSVYGKSNRHFNEGRDVHVLPEDQYNLQLRKEIDENYKGIKNKDNPRAVLAFFSNKIELEKFFNKPLNDDINSKIQIMTEELTALEKNDKIRQASISGSITFATRAFGRGTDFVCRDERVSLNGGVHVLQTFLSEELSEEVQIKGRTARQGDNGSYSLVILDTTLEKYGATTKEAQTAKSNGELYEYLNKKRNETFKKNYANRKSIVENAKKEHEESAIFLNSLFSNDIPKIKEYLLTQNRGPMEQVKSRTLILMDATGSMSNLLEKSKLAVNSMFERASTVLKESGRPTECFEVQFAVYRNYNVDRDTIIQSSSWEIDPKKLFSFMQRISVAGGLGPEAIEIGFWHVNKELETGEVTQVIVIGDAPANERSKILAYRKKYHDDKYWSEKFGPATDWKTELDKIVSRNVVVHTFYVDNYAEQNFKEIASVGKGKSMFLDVNASNGDKDLTDLVTQSILLNVGGAQDGETLKQAYIKKFGGIVFG